MEQDPLLALLPLAARWLAAAGLGAARLFGLLLILPLATRLGLTGLLRAAVAVALTLPSLPALAAAMTPDTAPAGAPLLLLAVKEAFVGLLLGALFAVPFWTAETAGEILDVQRGSRGALLPDPAGAVSSGITATLFALTLTVIFLENNGMRLVVQAVLESYRVWPPLDPVPHLRMDGGMAALRLLEASLSGGLVLAAPLLIAMLVAELALALISRVAPQLNVFDLAMAVKGLVFCLGLVLTAPVLLRDLRALLAPLLDLSPLLQSFGEG